MTEQTLHPPAADAPAPAAAGVRQETQFEYRPVPVSAAVGLTLALLGLTALLGLWGIPVALFATLVSATALWKIRASEGALGGRWLAAVGLVLGLVCSGVGITSQAVAYTTEVPEGFDRISFSNTISRPGVAEKTGPDGRTRVGIPKSVLDLDGRPVFLKGYMYPDPERRTEGIESFLLVKDLGDCCFGGQPALTDMIGVEFPEDAEGATFFEQTLVSVAGTFRVRKDFGSAENEPVYAIDAAHFDRSRSSF